VKFTKTGVDGELLLQHGCVWVAENESVFEYGSKYRKIDVTVYPPSQSDSGFSFCSKIYPFGNSNELIKQAKVNINIELDRIKPFYNQYVEESQKLQQPPNENEFIDSIENLNNISEKSKRYIYSELKTKQTPNVSGRKKKPRNQQRKRRKSTKKKPRNQQRKRRKSTKKNKEKKVKKRKRTK
jgi:hypothetical protein